MTSAVSNPVSVCGALAGEHHRLEGESLAARLRRDGILAPRTIAEVAIPLVEALVTVHRSGAIRRGLEPKKIYLARSAGRYYARLIGAASTTPDAVAYMAPEQFRGGTVDQRADVHAVGVVLYECLTGGLPHDAETTVELVSKIVRGDPASLPARIVETDPRLAAIVRKAMAYDVAARHPSSRELLEELVGWRDCRLRVDGLLADFLCVTPLDTVPRRRSSEARPSHPPWPPNAAPVATPDVRPSDPSSSSEVTINAGRIVPLVVLRAAE
jgi:serine/threonine protein kinase